MAHKIYGCIWKKKVTNKKYFRADLGISFVRKSLWTLINTAHTYFDKPLSVHKAVNPQRRPSHTKFLAPARSSTKHRLPPRSVTPTAAGHQQSRRSVRITHNAKRPSRKAFARPQRQLDAPITRHSSSRRWKVVPSPLVKICRVSDC